jgi:nucleoside-triphosphatase THEP1
MANVFLIYGPRGAGKTTTTLKLAEELVRRGIGVGGYFQQTTSDEFDRRGYDLVRFRHRNQTLPLARPGGVDKPGTSTVCSFSFSQEVFAAGIDWLKQDALLSRALVIDELGKLEARGEGHAQALRWALSLADDKVLLLSVRGDMLIYVVENFGLEGCVAGFMEIPAEPDDLAAQAEQLAAMLG